MPKEQCKRSVMCFATRCYRRIAQCTASTSVAEFFSCAMNLRWQPTIAGSPSVETKKRGLLTLLTTCLKMSQRSDVFNRENG
ncbi:hypothetical protein T05_3556 [Trichinella murrelli]|uniref:Uncharacterized protein n=1 Tax=Trichinella murrelli TaxID=144512 RepID=A0A0V0TQE8_9BILA|nr:hypothetical protein T05_3556 [Trichinella murrelli]